VTAALVVGVTSAAFPGRAETTEEVIPQAYRRTVRAFRETDCGAERDAG